MTSNIHNKQKENLFEQFFFSTEKILKKIHKKSVGNALETNKENREEKYNKQNYFRSSFGENEVFHSQWEKSGIFFFFILTGKK